MFCEIATELYDVGSSQSRGSKGIMKSSFRNARHSYGIGLPTNRTRGFELGYIGCRRRREREGIERSSFSIMKVTIPACRLVDRDSLSILLYVWPVQTRKELCLLTMMGDRKESSEEREREDEKLHYNLSFPIGDIFLDAKAPIECNFRSLTVTNGGGFCLWGRCGARLRRGRRI